jgi:hypothetical protein
MHPVSVVENALPRSSRVVEGNEFDAVSTANQDLVRRR